jgi:hypothetical protein
MNSDEQLAVLRDIYPAHKEHLGALAIEIRRAPQPHRRVQRHRLRAGHPPLPGP